MRRFLLFAVAGRNFDKAASSGTMQQQRSQGDTRSEFFRQRSKASPRNALSSAQGDEG